MYDRGKRVDLGSITVEELICELEKLPKEAMVACCGSGRLFLHVGKDGQTVCIDTDPLDAEYESEEGEE